MKNCFITCNISRSLRGCSGSGNESKGKTLDVELPLKTTSIAPYETDVPVKIGAAEALLKLVQMVKLKKYWLIHTNKNHQHNWILS